MLKKTIEKLKKDVDNINKTKTFWERNSLQKCFKKEIKFLQNIERQLN